MIGITLCAGGGCPRSLARRRVIGALGQRCALEFCFARLSKRNRKRFERRGYSLWLSALCCRHTLAAAQITPSVVQKMLVVVQKNLSQYQRPAGGRCGNFVRT